MTIRNPQLEEFCRLLGAVLLLAASASAVTSLGTIKVGTNPGEVVVVPSAHLAYVVNQGSNSVSVIDTQLLKVKATVTVGSSPIGIAANPPAGEVYVANSGAGTITPISGTTAGTPWTVGGTPSALILDTVLNQLYVMDTSRNQVEVLNATTGASLATVPTTFLPAAMTVNIATHAVFVACSGTEGLVVVIDGNTKQLITTVSVAKGTTSITVDPVTNIVIVESPSTNTHTAINAGSGYSTQAQTLGAPLGSAFEYGASDEFFFVTESSNTSIDFGLGSTGLFTLGNYYRIPELGGAGLTVNNSSNQLAALYNNTDLVYLIDLLNPLFPQDYHPLTAGLYVAGLAFDPLAQRLFVTNSSDNTVSAFSISPLELVDAYEGNYGGSNIDYNYIDSNPSTGMIYTQRLGTLYAINEAAAGAGYNGSGQNAAGVTAVSLANSTPLCMAVNVATNKIYVGDNQGNFYSVDGATNTATLITGLNPNTNIDALAIDYAANEILAWDQYTGNTLVFDGSTNALLRTIPTSSVADTGYLQVDSARNLAYLGGTNQFFVLDPAAGTIVTTIRLNGAVLGMALNAAKSRLYLIDNAKNLTIFNTSTNTIVTTITLSTTPYFVAVNPLSGNFYVAVGYLDVYEYSGATNKLIKDFSNSKYPSIYFVAGLLVNRLTDTVYVGTDSGTTSSVLTAIDERTGTVSVVPSPSGFDLATHVLALDLASGVVGGAGFSYTQLFFPNTDVSGGSVLPITVTGAGVVDSNTIATTPLFRTKSTQPSFAITATSHFGINASALVPTHLFYQLDGWEGTWKGATLKMKAGTQTSTATVKMSTALTTGLHTLYLFAGAGDVGTVQAGLPGGNSVANSAAISPIGSVVFTVEK